MPCRDRKGNRGYFSRIDESTRTLVVLGTNERVERTAQCEEQPPGDASVPMMVGAETQNQKHFVDTQRLLAPVYHGWTFLAVLGYSHSHIAPTCIQNSELSCHRFTAQRTETPPRSQTSASLAEGRPQLDANISLEKASSKPHVYSTPRHQFHAF